jgi:hypothetical protein
MAHQSLGADHEDLEERSAASKEQGEIVVGDTAVCQLWPHEASAPKPRWIGSGGLAEQEDAITQHIDRAYPEAVLTDRGHSQQAEDRI